MTGYIFGLTLRQLAGRKSTLLLAGLCSLPVLLALVFRLSDPDTNSERWVAALLVNFVVTIVLPLVALLLGTSVLGDELEDGTAIYLLTKPLPRWQILLPKLAASWLVAVALVLPATLAAGLIGLGEDDSRSLVTGFAVAVCFGTLAYLSVFVLLSLATNRALIGGLIYVFIWEGTITSIFAGTRYLSIRHLTLGIAGAVADVSPSVFDPYVKGATAFVLLVAVTVGASWFANVRLQSLEVREPH
jgi:ABC-2 type transport system permease protein